MLAQPSAQSYRFGPFEARVASGELLRRGQPVHLVDKSFQLLVALLERPGEVVSREELQSRLWEPGTFVDFDNNLNAAVRKLRETLGDSATEPRFVETLPRRGYRFVAPVEAVSPASSALEGQAPAPASRPGRWLAAVAFLGLVAVVVLAFWPRGAPAASLPDGKMLLAVLPFENLTGGADRDYFSDGMTEELITHLGRLRPERLGVIARLSAMTYKGSGKTAEQIGRELGADFLLQGSVRGDEERLRVTAQLIQVSDQTHLWAETYDRRLGDALVIQSEVAARVAGSLALELLSGDRDALARSSTTVTAAYEQYLRGRHQWRRFSAEGYRHATAHFGQAIELDPGFAPAHAGLADAYNLLAFDGLSPHDAFPRAMAAARNAVELDPKLAEAHNALAFGQLYYDFDPIAADRGFVTAHALSPNYAMAYHWHAGALSALERHDEALAAIRQALELDPISLSVLSDLGWYYLYADRYQEGLEVCEGALVSDPHHGWAQSCRDLALVLLGRTDEVVARARKGLVEDPERMPLGLDAPDSDIALGALLQFQLQQRRKEEAGGSASPLWRAMAHAALGEHDTAFTLLDEAYAQRDGWLVFLRVDPRFDPLRADPRFTKLCHRIGLPTC